MKLYIELFILGLPIAGVFALLATGVVMVYRASKILTLAQGAVAMFATYGFYQLANNPAETGGKGWGLPVVIAFPAALVFAGILGYAIERFLLRPLRDRPILVSVIMTVGLLALLTAIAGLIWSYDRQQAPQITPSGRVTVAGITVGYTQLTILAITAVLMLAVVYLFKYTTLGIAMRAVADDRRAALLMGIPADRVSSLTWIIGGVLAGLAGILLSPIVQLQPVNLTLIAIPAYAAALFGGLTNLTRMVVGALLLGVMYSEVPEIPFVKNFLAERHDLPGTRELSIFLVVIIFMFVTGKSVQLQEEEI
jgi:branched-subunit amino acid ABC-type transport system permease component